MLPTAPATTACVAVPPSIPFSQPRADNYSQGTTGFAIAAVLLAVTVAVLWVARRKGWGAMTSRKAETGGGEKLIVTQRLRLNPTCTAFVLGDGEHRVLIVESRHAVQISRLGIHPMQPDQIVPDAARSSNTGQA